MPVILPEFKTLSKYHDCCTQCKRVLTRSSKPPSEACEKPCDVPECCPYCQHPIFHPHGHYERKPDRGHLGSDSLNPIIIKRYRCGDCRRTFSALPECLPPRRWYLWQVQEEVLKAAITGKSKHAISQTLLPSRRTIGRWLGRFTAIWKTLQHHFKARWADLGYVANTFSEFWNTLLLSLSRKNDAFLLDFNQII